MDRQVRRAFSAIDRMKARAMPVVAGWSALRVVALLACVVQHVGCSARHGERPDAVPVAVDAGAEAGSDAGEQDASCRVRRAGRIFVGFSQGMSLDDFELAALEAERIIAALQAQLCVLDDTLDVDGSLRAALRTGAIEITSIVYTQDDAGAADVQARTVQGDAASSVIQQDAAVSTWSLRLMRTAGVWRVVSTGPA